MRRFQQIAPGVGLLLFGCTAAALVIQGCQPGKICGNDEYAELCANRQGGSGGGGTGGGGTGGGGSGGNRDSGGGMETAAVMVNADTPVPNCTEYNTLGKMDDFFGKRCGHDVACHTGSGSNAWSDLKMTGMFMRLNNLTPKFACTGDKLIDPVDWQKSVLLVKVRDAMPKCKNGSMAGLTVMPPPEAMQAIAMKQPALSDAEKTCVENYVRVVVTGK